MRYQYEPAFAATGEGELVSPLLEDLIFRLRITTLQACEQWLRPHADHGVVRVLRAGAFTADEYACTTCLLSFKAWPDFNSDKTAVQVIGEQGTISLETAERYRRFVR